MKPIITIPFNESEKFELTNCHQQKFLIWCEPCKTQFENYFSANNRKKLLQTMALIPPLKSENLVKLNYMFDVEAIFVNAKGTIQSIQLITTKEQKKRKYLNIDGYKFVLLAVPGFSKQFCLKIGLSKIQKPSNCNFSLNTPSKTTKHLDKLTTNDVLKHILKEKNSSELRSGIPTHYIWYHNLLFLVGRRGFPGYAASSPPIKITTELIPKLKTLGINPIIKEAVYRRFLMSSPEKTTKEDTWYGMENRGKFVTNNYIPCSSPTY